MGLHDRPYWKDDQAGAPNEGLGSRMAWGLPKPTPTVRTLLLITLSVFLVQIFLRFAMKVELSPYLGATAAQWWQPWRYITLQFLHSTEDLFHVGLNMLGLYLLGTPLEQLWGRRRFLAFYLTCGAMAGAAYVITGAAVGAVANIPIVGASGGVYGLLMACAILLPHFRVILFIFPVPIRLAALLIFGGMVLLILTSLEKARYSAGFWSDTAHLGGAVAAALWVVLTPYLRRAAATVGASSRSGSWEKKMKAQADEQAEIDRILQKIHDQGLNSLTRREKKTLADATRRQQERDREIYRA